VGSGNSSPVSHTANPARRSSLHNDACGAVAAEGLPSYPKFKKSREKFLKECADAKASGDYAKLVQFYGTAFQNFANINAVFKASVCSDLDFLYIYSFLSNRAEYIQQKLLVKTAKLVMRSSKL
jgi:hypothetical protein